jgi:hypothetical protein
MLDEDSDSMVVSENICSYLYNRVNSEWADCKVIDEKFGFNFGESELYVFAFNTGQANCIILRKGDKAVLFDAGGNFFEEKEREKAVNLLNGVHLDAVFITHPHSDHYSLLLPVFATHIARDTKFFFGGTAADWEEIEVLQNIRDIGNEGLYFCGDPAFFGNEGSVVNHDFLGGGVSFKIFNGGVPSTQNPNQKSFITKVEYLGKSLLFTGDAEGEEIDRHIGPLFLNLSQVVKLMALSHSIDASDFLGARDALMETGNVSAFIEFYKAINEGMDNILPSLDDAALEKFLMFVSTIPAPIRKELRCSHLIFLPHHGTNTGNSQRWLGYFANDRIPHCFVVNSSPFGLNRISKRSTIEFAPEFPRHPPHAVVYSKDESDVQSLQMTTKPLYITGSAPGGVECFLLHPDIEHILKLDVARRQEDDKKFRWFDIFNP